MSFTILRSFLRLIRQIQPSESELILSRTHIRTITSRLQASFKLSRVVAGGSFARSTQIRGSSDVDLFAILRRQEIKWGDHIVASTTMLDIFREELKERYPTTPISRDGQVIVAEFSKGPDVEIIPAIFDSMLLLRPLYRIPDGDGGWMKTGPSAHDSYIKRADEQSGGKLKKVAQLLKFWRNCSSSRFSFSSFHLELLLAWSGICKSSKSYSACFTEALQLLAERECRALQDPLGISGLIPAIKSPGRLDLALASCRFARDHAKNACVADYAGNTEEAWRQWNIVFNGSFPK